MIGQFLLTGISGTELTREEASFINEAQPAGVILFSRNFKNKDQLKTLTSSIQSLSVQRDFLISVDQEGGRVQRFKEGFTRIPAMMEAGKEGSAKKIFELHQILAKELIDCGINLNFSPVCDTLVEPNNDVIGDRAFSDNHEEVAKLSSAAIRGMLKEGLLCCAKHFPGHGRSLKDSHLEKVVVSMNQEEVDLEMIPFQRAVRAKVPVLMPSHMVVDYFDKDLPCSLSSNALRLSLIHI